MKIKSGLYAPTKEQMKATGTDGTPSPRNEKLNFKEKEGKLIPFSPTPRVGTSTVGSGAREAEVEEPVLMTRSVLFEFEVDEIPEPKALASQDQLKLILKYRSSRKVAVAIGASKTFVRQNIKSCKL